MKTNLNFESKVTALRSIYPDNAVLRFGAYENVLTDGSVGNVLYLYAPACQDLVFEKHGDAIKVKQKEIANCIVTYKTCENIEPAPLVTKDGVPYVDLTKSMYVCFNDLLQVEWLVNFVFDKLDSDNVFAKLW